MIPLVILLFVAAFLLVLFDMRRGARRQANVTAAAAKRGKKR
jgi:uncharacterized membrane protein